MKELLGAITIFLSLVGYLPYIRDIHRKKTKPHAFSWIIWTLVTFIIGFAQLAAGSGWGAVHNLVTGFVDLVILVYAFKNKAKDIKPVDIVLFALALISIALWKITHDPTNAIILVTAISVFAFVPTFRKTWKNPDSETLSSYAIAGVKYCLAIGAISTYGFATLLYPIALISMNVSLVTIMLIRRRR